MRFALSAEQRQFGAGVHALLAAAELPAVVRAWGAGEPEAGLAVWRRLAGLGVTGLAVPEGRGGLGAHPVDLVVAFEELGHHAVPGPLVESMAAVPTLLAELGADPTAADPTAADPTGADPTAADLTGADLTGAEFLRRLAAGEAIATLAFPPWLPYALDADIADLVLQLDRDTLLCCRSRPQPERAGSSVDPARRLFRCEPTAGSVLAAGPAVRRATTRAFDVGVLACAAQLLGAGRALLESATAYAGQRRQFGRPIGQFQAVKHQLADVLVGLELARPLLYGAAVALSDRAATASRDVSAAKVACADAADRAARTALQVHGAIGYTQEYHLGLWLTKVRALVGAWGTRAEHRARVAAALFGAADTGGRGAPPCGTR